MVRQGLWGLAAILLIAGIAWVGYDLPLQLPTTKPATVTFLDRNGRLLYTASDSTRSQPIALNDIAPVAVAATIAVEDREFFSHHGVSLRGTLRAVLSTLQGTPQGGSTITQQVVRLTILSPEEAADRSIRRKLREMVLAVILERRMSKDAILETYLNAVPYGGRAVGIEAAARTYFGTSASNLSLSEAALLAGLPQAPGDLDPRSNPDAAKLQQRMVLDRMLAAGFIDPSAAGDARAIPLEYVQSADPIVAAHAVTGGRDRWIALARPAGGSRVITTIDAGLQSLAEDTINRNLANLTDKDVTNAALVAIDPKTGDILAMAGSANYFDNAIDGAVNIALSLRQPGSAIKPLTYAAAFERGMSPATVLPDVRTVYTTRTGEPYVPVNYDHDEHGPLSLRVALASSINIVAVETLSRIGVDALANLGVRLGLSNWSDGGYRDLSMTLGGSEVRLLDLTGAYAAFANQGQYRTPRDVLRIEDAGGTTLRTIDPSPVDQAVSPQTAFLISNVLSDPAARSLGFGDAPTLEINRPAAVKTGTTSLFRDNWTIGYTPDLVVGVWVGNADGSPMREITGITGAAPIWRDFMREALRGSPVRQFPVPVGIQWVDVCAVDGLLAGPTCPLRTIEPVQAGNAPESVSTAYVVAPIDLATGLLAAPGCSGPVRDRMLWNAPFEYRDWADRTGLPVLPVRSCTGTITATPDLVVSSPDNNATFRINGRTPAASRQVRFAAQGAGTVRFAVDGTIIGSGTEAWWSLVPGDHVVTVDLVDTTNTLITSVERHITVLDAN